MKCPYCGQLDSKVIDSRNSKDGALIRRRRECERCAQRFTTYEHVEEVAPVVVKKDGRRELFDRQKLVSGIRKACEKRPVSMETIEEVVNRIERWAFDRTDNEVKADELGAHVMQELKSLDEIAYVRFASVYRSFKDINEFMGELRDLLAKEQKS